MMRSWWCALVIAATSAPVAAHPVAKSAHDRKITVRLLPAAETGHITIRVEYALEVDETTVLLEDMLPYQDEVDFTKYRNRPLAFYAEYARLYAPILGGRLVVRCNNQRLEFAESKDPKRQRTPRLVADDGTPLGHLRCEFTFEALAPIRTDGLNTLTVRENNFLLQDGQIELRLINEAGVEVRELKAPDEALFKKTPSEYGPGDEDRLRNVRIMFSAAPAAPAPPLVAPMPPAVAEPAPPTEDQPSQFFSDDDSLYAVMTSDAGFWLKMLFATLFGAAHALTPGHGKTLVAAYLIGQRGTMWHALTLGIITTVTHTGAVLILAGILFFLPPHLKAQFAAGLQQGLGLVAGLMVVGLGLWLLLQRLSGRADHFHVGGGHSHSHGSAPVANQETGVRWWGLVVLGVTGGLIPCWDAIIIFLYFVGRGEFWLVLPALIAFSAGLAAVLVLIGVLVVQVPKFTRSRWGEGRVVQALPLVSAVVIIAIGVWLCTKTVAR